jgi:GTP-binding protein
MSIPMVTIVGRPNVGKSTVFNRIIKKRKAIVDDISGVTRDRNTVETDWNGFRFLLTDTGGYIPNTEKLIEKEVKEQVEVSIKESDLILFVVDVRNGITKLDNEIGRILLKSGKNIVLAVNKVDNENLEVDADEFYKLGFSEMSKIAALNGRNIGELLDKITKKFDLKKNYPEEKDEKEVKIAIVGKQNVGKSSYVNAVIGEERMIVTEEPGTTRDSIDSLIKFKKIIIRIIDTAGLKKLKKIKEDVDYYSLLRTYESIDRSDISVVMVDAEEGLTKNDLQILDYCVKKMKGVLLVYNKWDKIKKKEEQYAFLEKETYFQLKNMNFIPMLTISVLENLRLFNVLDMCIKIFQERTKKVDTKLFNNVIQSSLKKYPPPVFLGKKINIKFGTQISVSPQIFLLFTNIPKGIKPNYKRYLEKEIRNNFGYIGVPILIKFKKK